ncbi:MAG: gamma-glutamyltransferase family protein, partial [Balneolaceae bacterium]
MNLLKLTLFIFTINASAIIAQDRLSGKLFATRSEVIAKNGMAATNHPLASQIALDILKMGGSAVDAAIAANAFLGFADPAMNGPGGDMFAIVWSAEDEKLIGLNASGKSPQNLTAAYFKEKNMSRIPAAGPLSITVPGVVDGWFALHNRFGNLEFQTLMAPTINYAREGVGITSETAELMDYLERDLIRFYNLSDDFQWEDLQYFSQLYRKNGRFPQKGELFRNPDLANTLEKISKQGRYVFYEGEIAHSIVSHIRDEGGFMTMDDFINHKSIWVDPVHVNYKGFDIWEIPPNTQGISVLQILNILEGYDLSKYGFGSKEHVHYFVEAKKLAYADMLTYYGDPDFNSIPVKKLLSKDYATERKNEIRDDWAQSYGPGLESDNHTVYLTVADKEGNIISLIQSNSWLFGSLVTPPGLGFPLQNRGNGFTLGEGHINSYEPGKRPFHTIIPAFITKDDTPYISFGLTGGDRQPQGH